MSATQARHGSDSAVAAHMRQVFNYMSGGVAISALVAWLVLSNPAMLSMAAQPATQIIFLIIWLGYGFLGHKIVFNMSAGPALATFCGFCAVTGFALSPLVYAYTGASVVTAFATAAVMFAGASAYGYFSKKSLSGWGNFLMMGAWGLIGAIVVNLLVSLFTGSPISGLSFIISLIAVPLFAGITAWETNMLKETFHQYGGDEGHRTSVAIYAASSLYMNFVIMFIHLLSLIGERR